MATKAPKAPKGTVTVIVSNGRLQARWHWQGKRYYLSLGLADTPKNRRLVAGRVAQMQRDLDYGEFNGDLSKYKPQATTSYTQAAQLGRTVG